MKCPGCGREMYLLEDKDFYQCPGNPRLPRESSESCYRVISKEEAIKLYDQWNNEARL